MSKKERQYTELQKKFLDAYADPRNGGDFRTCMRIAGYSDNVATREIAASLREEILDLTRDMLVVAGPKAAAVVINTLQNGSDAGAANKLKAAQMVFDRAGVVTRSESQVSLNVPSGGIVIMPAKNPLPDEVTD